MYAQVIGVQDGPADLEAGSSHLLDKVVSAADATPGVHGTWLADRESGER
ncbi:MAG TPA: hypothetical protein VNF73_01435 [Candidatus Saccharimonadales bacterium]|nr:hypothetical protein [Candidatus Saccharimonadales bacterium]